MAVHRPDFDNVALSGQLHLAREVTEKESSHGTSTAEETLSGGERGERGCEFDVVLERECSGHPQLQGAARCLWCARKHPRLPSSTSGSCSRKCTRSASPTAATVLQPPPCALAAWGVMHWMTSIKSHSFSKPEELLSSRHPDHRPSENATVFVMHKFGMRVMLIARALARACRKCGSAEQD